MAIKIFLDTNIIFDLLDTDRQYNSEALEIFNGIENNKFIAYFSESVIATADYIFIKKYTLKQRLQILKDLLNLITVIECTNIIVESAIENTFSDVEDLILHELAKSKTIDYFITNDKQAQKKLTTKKLPVIGSKAFLKMVG
jgi:predicted nucleic acid-binding protein